MRVLVTGATRNVGRLVVDRLAAVDGVEVRALTTDPARASLPEGVEPVVGFVGRPESVRPALEGVEKLYLAPHPATAAQVSRMAAEAGVRHVVDLAGVEGTDWFGILGDVEAAGVGWTHLCPGEFMDNALVLAPQIRERGAVLEAYPDATSTMIDLPDIADVAAAALLDDAHVGRRYDLSGPDALTRRELIATIGTAIGRDIACEPATPEQAAAALASEMGEYARWYVDGLADLTIHPQQPRTTVTDLLGTPATHVADWARANAAAFR